MKKTSFKKIALVTAALCTLTAITAVAGGKYTTLFSHASHADEIRNFSEVSQLTEKADMKFKYVEEFENGYKFDYAVPAYTYGEDSSTGKSSNAWIEANLAYTKDGEATVNFSATKTYFDDETCDSSIDYEKITINYNCDNYLFLPPDTKPSEEDKALEEAGELFISYGSSEEQRNVAESVNWIDDGIRYSLMTMDGSLGAEGLTEMAKEIIDFDK